MNYAQERTVARAQLLFRESLSATHASVDRMFGYLMAFQYVGCVLWAFIASPRTWSGSVSFVHPHVWTALLLGGIIAVPTMVLAWTRAGRPETRWTVAVTQMLMSALLIHVSGGRIETHFHVFGSLAFLAFYRDWRLLVPATLVVLCDHVIRGIYFPASVYGVDSGAQWRFVEHACWVVFENIFLTIACANGLREMRLLADRQALLEVTNEEIEGIVQVRTEELRLEQRRYDRIVANVPGVVFQLERTEDAKYRFVFLSPSLKSELGHDPLLLSEDPALLFDGNHQSEQTSFLAAFAQSAAALKPVRWEGRIQDRSGVEKWYRCEAQPERMENNVVVWDGILLDVTTHKQAEADARERLASERANEAKSEFLSRMSHELRTPLNAILGFGQIIEMGDEDLHENVGYILKAGRHLLCLVNEVLDISSIETGNIQLSVEPVALDDLLGEVASLMGPAAQEAGIDLRVEAADANGYVMADVRRLRQVLLNLVSNAIKYNVNRGHVSISYQPSEPGRVRIAVSDDGPGIPMEKRDRIFMPFERLGAEQTTKEGTGLGLALSKKLAEVMRGQLWMEDVDGGGCVFYIELEAVRPLDISESDSNTLSTSKTTLYIEDNFSNTKLMQRIADHASLKLYTSTQGRLGFEEAKALQPDLILLDLDLPDIDGMEVLSMLRRCASTKDIPIVVVSADANGSREKQAMQNGATGYVTKPFDVPVMMEIFRANLGPLGEAA